MKKNSTLFLKLLLAMVAVVTVAGLVYFPQIEGRAANLDLVGIYSDPLIIYVYIGSIPFFVALYQAYKLMDAIGNNKVFSQAAVNILRNIKYCAFMLSAAIVAAVVFIRFNNGDEDPAGPIALGIIATFTMVIIATFTAVLQKLLQEAIKIKSENDLTV